MADITPTTEAVRNAWCLNAIRGRALDFDADRREYREEFDRWLAAHDRDVAAAAWRRGASDVDDFNNGDGPAVMTNPYTED